VGDSAEVVEGEEEREDGGVWSVEEEPFGEVTEFSESDFDFPNWNEKNGFLFEDDIENGGMENLEEEKEEEEEAALSGVGEGV
jgi:hypothetical protein